MNLVRTSFLNGIAVVIKLVCSIFLNKLLAIYVGPAGYALIGQFQNVIAIIVSLAGGVLSNGVTKATAEYFDNEVRQYAVWKTAVRLSLIVSIFASIIILFASKWLSSFFLHSNAMSSIFVWLALTLPAMTINNLLIAILNGKKDIHSLVATNIAGSFVNILITGSLAFKFGMYGALVAFTINAAVALFTTGLIVSRLPWLKMHYLWGKIDSSVLRELSGFAMMGLTSALTLPVSYILIRDHLVQKLGLVAAGYWQALTGISGIFLLLVTSTLSVYYLPRLAEIRTAFELKEEIIKLYRLVLPVVIVGALLIYILRDFIIRMLFTPDFLPMSELFFWQLSGDILKISSWILGYVLVGRSMTKVFIITEVTYSILLVLFSKLFIERVGLLGAPFAYSVSYLFYGLLVFYFVFKELKKMKKSDLDVFYK